MKTTVRKFASCLVALATVACFCVPTAALATNSSEDEAFSITVAGAIDGETYSAYKIFEVTYDTDADAYAYTIDSGSAWFGTVQAASDVFKLEQVGTKTTYNVTVVDGVTDTDLTKVFTDAGIPSGTSPDAQQKASDGTAELDVSASGPGYYYVTTSVGSLVMIDTTAPAAQINEKNGTPTLTKQVHENSDADDEWGNHDDANNNESVLFDLKIENINGTVNLVLHDSMEIGLEIPDAADFHLSSISLRTTEDADPVALTEGSDYTISVGSCTVEGCPLADCAFEVQFKRDFSDVDATGFIELTYGLLLDTKDASYNNDYDEIANQAQLTYGTSSHSAPVQTETYSFGFEVFKYTGDDADSGTGLSDVEFELQDASGQTGYFLAETVGGKTIYLFEGWTAPSGSDTYTQTLVTADDGMLYVEGLDTGTYILTETKARGGYAALTEDVTVTISATYAADGSLTDHTVTYSYAGTEGSGTVNILNQPGTELPGTGGMGTTIFYIIGAILVIAAVVLLIVRRRLHARS